MRRLKRILGVLLIFIFGMIVGGVGAGAGFTQKVREVLSGGPEAVVKEIVRGLDKELTLDPEQKRELQRIADETHIRLRQSRAKIQPEVDRTLAEAEGKVRAILYPNQVEKFDKLVHRRGEKWRATEGAVAVPPVAPEPSPLEPAAGEAK